MEFIPEITSAPKKGKRKLEDGVDLESVKEDLFKVAKVENSPHLRYAFTESGSSVYKFAYDKFVTVRWTGGQTKVIFAEYKQQVDGTWKVFNPNKFLALSKPAFLRLCGLILTGKADLTGHAFPPSPDGKNGKLSPLYCLDEGLYFGWGRFNNVNVATIRKYWVSPKKDLLPTKNGLSFGEKGYDVLKELVLELQLARDVLSVDKAHKVRPLNTQGLAYATSKQELAELMFYSVVEQRQADRSVPRRGLCTDEEFAAAEEEILEKKRIEGVLLMANQLDIGQLLGLDSKEYLKTHRAEIRGLFDKMLL